MRAAVARLGPRFAHRGGLTLRRIDAAREPVAPYGHALPSKGKVESIGTIRQQRGLDAGTAFMSLLRYAATWEEALDCVASMPVSARQAMAPEGVASIARLALAASLVPLTPGSRSVGLSKDNATGACILDAAAEQAVNASFLDEYGTPDWVVDETVEDDTDVPPSRSRATQHPVPPSVRHSLCHFALDASKRALLSPSTWINLALLQRNGSSTSSWEIAVSLHSVASRQCDGIAPEAVVAVAMSLCVRSSQWSVALEIYRQRRRAHAAPSLMVAFAAMEAAQQLPRSATPSIWSLALLALRDAADAVSDNQFATNPRTNIALAEQAAVLLLRADSHRAVLDIASNVTSRSAGDSLDVPSAATLLLGAAAALAVPSIAEARTLFDAWGHLHRSRLCGVSNSASFELWRTVAGVVRGGPSDAGRLALRFALNAVTPSQLSLLTYGQMRAIPLVLSAAATRPWLSEDERSAVWIGALRTYGAASEVTDRLDTAFVHRVASAAALNVEGFERLRTAVRVNEPDLADAVGPTPIRHVSAANWVDGLHLLQFWGLHHCTEHDVHFSAVLGSMCSNGAWEAAMRLTQVWFADHQPTPWAMGKLLEALVRSGNTARWATAVRCYALASPQASNRRTHFASFLEAAGLSAERVAIIVMNQRALRAGMVTEVSVRSIDEARF